MPAKVKQKQQADPAPEAGRVQQRNRTRKAIVGAAMRLLATGRTPNIGDIVQEAQVSRRTVYMYFPTLEQLLLDATLGALGAAAIEPVIDAPESLDPATRIENLSRAMTRLSGSTLHLGRALIRLTVEGEPEQGKPRRGYRRIEWIERALAPARKKLPRKHFERLVSSLSVVMGWEALVVLKDIRGLDPKETEEVLAFTARAIVDAALKSPGKL